MVFTSDYIYGIGVSRGENRKVKVTLAALVWQLKESKLEGLLDEITQYRIAISLAFSTESM